jgi:lon-related putative ATP-dependent protease
MKEALGELEEGLGELIQRTFPRWERETRSAIRDASETVTRRAVGHLIDEVRREYRDAPEILAHLDAMETDVIANAEEFLAAALPAEAPALLAARISDGSTFRRYQVNLIVDRTDQVGAPVVFEDLPTEPNLVGRVEHAAHLGALVTDVTLIRPGALHRANGGYLVLDARRLLGQPLAWDALKRALRGDEIRIESPGERLGLIATASLEPQPIPLDAKVVLIGDRVLYHLLADLDPDFLELFKVQVDFEEEIPRTLETEQRYARLFGTIAAGEGLRPLEPGGAAAIVEHASRLAGDAERLSTHMRRLTDVLREADDHAARAERTTIGAGDVDSAIAAGRRRAARLHERSLEDMTRGTLLVRTTGEAVGVANGLSVISLGESSFGRPSRITARVRLGDGEVVDIEREVDLGGPLHSKGVLILAGFVGGRYGRERPLSVRASLVFEQSYGGVEGDSATLAETCALLSALGEVPIRQSIAMTGSLDQQGDIQPVGGLDEKIEGFFEICAVRGLDGSQGVIIPAANVANLMLRPEVVEAARRGRFSIWAVATIDEALEILTGRPAGKADRSGRYPDGSVNGLVVAGLSAMAERARAFARGSVPTSTDDGRRRATRVPARGARKEPVGSPTVPGPSVP